MSEFKEGDIVTIQGEEGKYKVSHLDGTTNMITGEISYHRTASCIPLGSGKKTLHKVPYDSMKHI